MISSRSLSIAAAVGFAIAGSQAMALDLATTNTAIAAGKTLVVAGASAQRDAFLQLLTQDLCTAGSVDVYRATPTGGQDFRAYSCHTVSSGAPATALQAAANQDIVVYYRSEGGSAWGPYSIAQRNVQGAAFPGVKSLDVSVCAAGTTSVSYPGAGSLPTHDCALGATYRLSDDANGSGGAVTGLVNRVTQLGTADVEPKLFTGANSPALTSSKFSTAPAVVTALKNLTNETGFGQVFTLLLNSSAAGAADEVTNLTSAQATGIFTGTIVDWCQISQTLADCASGGSHPITVVRREPGSGTQVGAGVKFANVGCGDSWGFVVDTDPAGTPIANDSDFVIEVGATGTLETTVNTVVDSIGINLYKATVAQANTHQITLDGVAANRANAANLSYPYAFEATYTKANSTDLAAGTISAGIANGLIVMSKDVNRVPNNQAVFALPSATNIPGTSGTPSTAPVALGTRGGASCRPFQPQ
ncbi:MAG TPA: hypothetical protein VMF52_11835 [Steroidobacteraceae bacterium]|nr:hypothetical protein [Steroidobacteraceae bacterium]